jgi:outer membrane translocation and assembly module TamA
LLNPVVGYFGEAAMVEERPRFFHDDEPTGRAEFDRRELSLGLQRQVGTALLLRIGGTLGRVRTRFHEEVGLPAASDKTATLHSLVVWDDMDDRHFPAHGRAISLSAEKSLPSLDASRDYWRLASRGRYAVSLAKRTVLEAQVLAAGSERDVPIYKLPRLGGPDLLPGYHRDALWGRNALGAAIGPSFVVIGRLRFKGWVGAGNVWDNRDQVSLRSMKGGFGLALGLPTRLGPLSVAWGRSDSRPSRVYLSAGYD